MSRCHGSKISGWQETRTRWIVSNFIDLFYFHLICQMLATFSGLNPKGPFLRLEKEKEAFCVVLTYSIKRAREIRKFHFAVLQQRLRTVQKSMIHVQSCFFAVRLRRWKNSLLLSSRNFATMVTGHHTSPVHWSDWFRSVLLTEHKPQASDVWAKIWQINN